jgi:hypothetical protein
MSALKMFVPVDAAARAVGADQTAQTIAAEARRRQIDVEIIRNGSRGLLWLEPLVEVEVAGQRHAYGPVAADQVADLFAAGFASKALPARTARPRRRRISRRHQVEDRARRRRERKNTSSAMPTRATAAPSPIACSWRAIRSC